MYEMLPEVAVHVLTMDNQLPVSDKHYQVQNCLFLRFLKGSLRGNFFKKVLPRRILCDPYIINEGSRYRPRSF